MKELEGCSYEVLAVKKRRAPEKAAAAVYHQHPAAGGVKKLNMSTQKSMRLAQELYEGVSIKGRGNIGLITYLRTDSTRISEEADAACREYIQTQYGEDFVGNGAARKTGAGKIQDAHEAIRPTDVTLSPSI